MCGVLGYSGSFDPVDLAVANEAQCHRGPDDRGEFVDHESGIGLGHVRLSILDLSAAGHQPMHDDSGTATVVLNGEIYNFRELRSQLESEGHRFRSQSDTEVLLELYLRDGPAMLQRLNGIFALAIWDRRQQSLLVARDALGVKPLYYAETPQGFVFASEIKALLRLAPGLRELDLVAIHRYLSFLWSPGEATPLRQVRKLLPGAAMIVRAGRIEKRWNWYTLPAFRPGPPQADEAGAVRGTADLLRQAVHRQLVADVPVGAFLSGGLDSSAVVAFAKEQVPDIQCFTIDLVGGQDAGYSNDLPYARKVAKHLGVSLSVVTVDAHRLASDLEGMFAQLDEPLADPAPLNVLYISRLAREHGMKVLLSGAGGDDLFSGYGRHLALVHERYWAWLPAWCRSGLESVTSGFDRRNPTLRRMAKAFEGASLPSDTRLTNYFHWARESQLLDLYTPEFRAGVAGELAAQPLQDFIAALPGSVPALERMLTLEQRFFLVDHNLTYTDKMSMAAGVEVRVPFLDPDLVEFAATIPAHLKQRGRTSKWVLKQAMSPYLPREIIHRPKTGFGAPLRRWMRHELRPLLGDVLSEASLRKRGLFDPAAVQRLIRDNYAGKVDAAYTLLSLLAIEIWCRRFVDAPVMRPAAAA